MPEVTEPERGPTTEEYDLLDENDQLRRMVILLRAEVKIKDESISGLELKLRARTHRLEQKDEELYQLGVTVRDLRDEIKRLHEQLAKSYVIHFGAQTT
jgi:hypothetical protein